MYAIRSYYEKRGRVLAGIAPHRHDVEGADIDHGFFRGAEEVRNTKITVAALSWKCETLPFDKFVDRIVTPRPRIVECVAVEVPRPVHHQIAAVSLAGEIAVDDGGTQDVFSFQLQLLV